MKHKRNRRHQSRHHIIPCSRGGCDGLENVVRLDIEKHQDYHTLFCNMVPTEILQYLTQYFWKGNYEYVREVYERHYGRKL